MRILEQDSAANPPPPVVIMVMVVVVVIIVVIISKLAPEHMAIVRPAAQLAPGCRGGACKSKLSCGC